MARVQTRRTISINRLVYERTSEHAIDTRRPMSQIVEDLLLTAIGDEAFKAEILARRTREAQRLEPKPKKPVQPADPTVGYVTEKPGRRPGVRPVCSACGDKGHASGKDGMCSPTYLAARLVVDHGWDVAEAAKENGVSRQVVYQRLKAGRTHAA